VEIVPLLTEPPYITGDSVGVSSSSPDNLTEEILISFEERETVGNVKLLIVPERIVKNDLISPPSTISSSSLSFNCEILTLY